MAETHDQTMDRIKLQNAEFDALTELSKHWSTLQQVAVVDDDYPFYRSRYEGAMRTFVAAIAANGRLADFPKQG